MLLAVTLLLIEACHHVSSEPQQNALAMLADKFRKGKFFIDHRITFNIVA